MKTLTFLLIIMLINIPSHAQEIIELPYFDDFEKENVNNITFTNWTTENLLGSKFWFTMFDWNNNPGQFLYFGNSYNIENDWLITKPINCKGINQLKIDFDLCFRDAKTKPKLFYTNSYNGDASQSNWTELDYISSQLTYTWQHSAEIIFDNHEDTIYIAFQYQAAANAGTTFMFDNFMVRSYAPSTPFDLVGFSEHFEFYGNLPADNLKHWNQISSGIDYWYKELCSYWDRPGIAPIFNSKEKIKIFLGDSNAFENELSVMFPNWKYNYIKSKNEIYLKLPDADTDNIYAGDLITLVKNSLAQLIINLHFAWKCESYLAEGFGLYYGGYKPNKEKIVQGLADLGTFIELYDIKNLNDLDKGYKKDFLVSYIEAQALSCFGIQRIGSNYPVVWPNHLEYYYNKPDNERIKLQKQSDHFFIYAADQDIQFIDSISKKIEEKLTYYQTAFDTIIRHPINCVIYPNVETASACLGRSTDANGGSAWSGDKLDVISKLNYTGSRDYYKIVSHELFHVFHFNLVTFLFNIKAFHFEGMADIMTFEGENDEMLAGKSMEFRDGLTRFINDNGREPMLAEIMNVPYMSVYTYGQAFWHFMHKNYTDYPTIKKFFVKGCNWNVFDIPYEQIDSEYIVYLKTLAGMVNSAPDVESNAPSVITKVSANLNGNVISDGGATITQRGFYWSSTNASPNSGDHVEVVSGTTGNFSKTLENLTSETTYYFRAFATNSFGISLGVVKQFTTLVAPVLADLPFFDDFEETITNDAIFTKWTTENLEGWHYWHIIPWNGNPGQCMRFQTTDINQIDWLITKPINCESIDQIVISFDTWFMNAGTKPKLFYTNSYNGNASQSNWTELNYSIGENQNTWNSSSEIVISNPGNVLYLAFQYQADANEGIYFLLDNVLIEGRKFTNQTEISMNLQFNSGWNLFSVPIHFKTSNIKTLFQPLIDNNSLVKIQDEQGNALEDWGFIVGWKNFIGDIQPTEGYKIKLNFEDSLEVIGDPLEYPFAIPLSSGWNIMGYSQHSPFDAMKILQPLINNGTLQKVQDEAGNAIEDWGSIVGWKNFIGNFVPGEGYKIKLFAADTMWIQESYPKSAVVFPELAATQHFNPEFKGHGVDHMNINIGNLPVNLFQPGDELAVFDGELCVGAITLLPCHLNSGAVSIAASATDDFGMPGYTEGNLFTLKLWSAKQQQEIELEPEILKGPSFFVKHESMLLSLHKYATTELDGELMANKTKINCYPNPFSDEVTIEINLSEDAEVQIEVLNQLGQKVRTPMDPVFLTQGLHLLNWNGKNYANRQVSSGIYLIRVVLENEIVLKKIILSKTE